MIYQVGEAVQDWGKDFPWCFARLLKHSINQNGYQLEHRLFFGELCVMVWEDAAPPRSGLYASVE